MFSQLPHSQTIHEDTYMGIKNQLKLKLRANCTLNVLPVGGDKTVKLQLTVGKQCYSIQLSRNLKFVL